MDELIRVSKIEIIHGAAGRFSGGAAGRFSGGAADGMDGAQSSLSLTHS